MTLKGRGTAKEWMTLFESITAHGNTAYPIRTLSRREFFYSHTKFSQLQLSLKIKYFKWCDLGESKTHPIPLTTRTAMIHPSILEGKKTLSMSVIFCYVTVSNYFHGFFWQVFPMIIQCLPLKEDFEENPTVYSCIIEMFSDQHPQVSAYYITPCLVFTCIV